MENKQREIYTEYAKTKSHEMQSWEKDYRARILRILKDQDIEITLENIPEIIEATSFKNLSSNPRHKWHCSYYREDSPKQCHPEIKDLNCFLCSCPDYDSEFIQINENGHDRVVVGKCGRNSKRGRYFSSPSIKGFNIWDCSSCSAYHHPQAVERYLRENISELQKT